MTSMYFCQNLKIMEIKDTINEVWNDRSLLKQDAYSNAIKLVIEEVDKGRLRVAEPQGDTWVVNEWVKQAILMYFAIQPMQTWELAPFEFHDKMLLKSNYAALGVRAVPHAVARRANRDPACQTHTARWLVRSSCRCYRASGRNRGNPKLGQRYHRR